MANNKTKAAKPKKGKSKKAPYASLWRCPRNFTALRAFRMGILGCCARSDGGDACYVRFMPRVRSALGPFYGSARLALGHVRSALGHVRSR